MFGMNKGSLKTEFYVFRLPLSRARYSALGFALKLFAVSTSSKNSACNPYSSGLAADFASAAMSVHVILPLYCPPCRAWAYEAGGDNKRKGSATHGLFSFHSGSNQIKAA